MITTQNYFEEYGNLLPKVPKVMQNVHELIAKTTKNGTNWRPYNSSEKIKLLVDKQIENLTQIKSGKGKAPNAKKPSSKQTDNSPLTIINGEGEKLKLIGWNHEGTAVYESNEGIRHINDGAFISGEQLNLMDIAMGKTGVMLNAKGEREQKEFRIAKPYSPNKPEPCKEPPKAKAKPTSSKSTAKSATQKTTPARKKKPASKGKPKKVPKSDPAELVRDLTVELRLVSRFVNLYKKVRTYKQILNLFKAVTRAIKKGHVRKTENPTLCHKEIAWIQKMLLKWLSEDYSGEDENEELEIDFPEKEFDKLKNLKKKFSVYPSVRLGIRFIGMEGKAPEKERVEALIKAIERAEKSKKLDPQSGNMPSLKSAKKALNAYLQGKTSVVKVQSEAMHGIPLEGENCGCAVAELNGPYDEEDFLIPPLGGDPVMYAANEIPDLQGKEYHFTGQWEELFNQPEQGFSVLLHGAPKSGKSTLAVDFAGYLARNFGNVLYASLEEGVRGTIKNRLIRRGADHPDIQVPNYLPADLSPWDFIFIDSASHAKLTPDFLNMLIAKWPTKNFVFVFHETKSGKWYGSNQAGHATDIVARVEKLNEEQAEVVASGRWGPGDTIIDFENATGLRPVFFDKEILASLEAIMYCLDMVKINFSFYNTLRCILTSRNQYLACANSRTLEFFRPLGSQSHIY